MEAGRELDALVAEKVMGLRLASVEEYCRWLHYAHKEVEKFKKHSCRFIGPDEFGVFNKLAYYSEDIADAWAVHEYFKGKLFSRRRKYLLNLEIEVRRELGQPVAWPDLLMYLMPHHICLAALHAMRNSVE